MSKAHDDKKSDNLVPTKDIAADDEKESGIGAVVIGLGVGAEAVSGAAGVGSGVSTGAAGVGSGVSTGASGIGSGVSAGAAGIGSGTSAGAATTAGTGGTFATLGAGAKVAIVTGTAAVVATVGIGVGILLSNEEEPPPAPETPPPIVHDVGDIIQFGDYDWRILELQDDKMLVISEYILEDRIYHDFPEFDVAIVDGRADGWITYGSVSLDDAAVTWATSDMRAYLNGEFLNSFSESDRSRIADASVTNDDNPWFGTSGGNDTTDKIFLLSIDEVARYFGDSGMLARGVDENARDANLEFPNHGINLLGISDEYDENRIAHHVGGTYINPYGEEYTIEEGKASSWWLRSSGNLPIHVAFSINGIYVHGLVAEANSIGVRPAMWLTLTPTATATPTPKPDPTPTPEPPPDVGDIIQFGDYDWRVLDVQDGKALIITDEVIEFRAYHGDLLGVTWATSDIRAYLNGEFYNSFSEADRTRIADTNVVNDDNPWTFLYYDRGNTPGGSDTRDKMFLLSIDEVIRYFGDSGMLDRGLDEDVRIFDLEWSNHGAYGIYWWGIHDKYGENRMTHNAGGEASSWWLRSPGITLEFAAEVIDVGAVNVGGLPVQSHDDGSGGIRPALWLILE